uniref:Uncharacterized protein n=1 Tax=Marmota marmota marmota TaxID=9994 RepID=A0A8C5Z1G4_MARMA
MAYPNCDPAATSIFTAHKETEPVVLLPGALWRRLQQELMTLKMSEINPTIK